MRIENGNVSGLADGDKNKEKKEAKTGMDVTRKEV